MMAGRCRIAVLCVCTTLLAACATGPRSVPGDREVAWSEQRERLEALSGWRAKGRLAVRTPDDAGNANFVWVEAGDEHFRLRLEGPLGHVLGEGHHRLAVVLVAVFGRRGGLERPRLREEGEVVRVVAAVVVDAGVAGLDGGPAVQGREAALKGIRQRLNVRHEVGGLLLRAP